MLSHYFQSLFYVRETIHLAFCSNRIEFSQFHNGTAINWCPSLNLSALAEKNMWIIYRPVCMVVDTCGVWLHFDCVSKSPIEHRIHHCVDQIARLAHLLMQTLGIPLKKTMQPLPQAIWSRTTNNAQFSIHSDAWAQNHFFFF